MLCFDSDSIKKWSCWWHAYSLADYSHTMVPFTPSSSNFEDDMFVSFTNGCRYCVSKVGWLQLGWHIPEQFSQPAAAPVVGSVYTWYCQRFVDATDANECASRRMFPLCLLPQIIYTYSLTFNAGASTRAGFKSRKFQQGQIQSPLKRPWLICLHHVLRKC